MSYSTVRYEDPNDDEYESYSPSAFLTWWYDVKNGIDMSVSYDRTEFDISENTEDTWSGDIRFIHKMTRHFQVYVKYAHTYSEDDTQEHSVYNPSAGFDWNVSETSSVSMGAGVLINRYEDLEGQEDQEDSEDLFVDLDVFKTFSFSRRNNLTISASSGYEESGAESASLGFTTYYQAGFNWNYALTKRSNFDLTGSWTRDEYHEEPVDRLDNTYELSAGISWTPLRWMSWNASYTYTNFETDAQTRDDYEENRATITVSLYPYQPARSKDTPTRENVESKIFNEGR